ncbi:MAG TPA: hypothetical protein VK769_04020, partial [Verrucomicrobiae bacterium]|nr:hypothetical protein [Verrucomicrobiae bacterium]
DVLVDFGLQLYMPWRISHGAVLYRDIYFFAGGPLSQYFNALLFKIFGTSFSVLIISNLTAVVAMLLLVYRRFLAAADALTATTICLGIVLVFAFAEYTTIGNYNYIAPYSHEALHGLVLSIFAIALLADWLKKEQLRFAFAAGFCGGMVFLTKAEIFLALAVSAFAAFVLFCATRRKIRFAAKSLAVFLAASIIPLLGSFLFFLNAEDWRASLHSACFAFAPLLQTSIVKNPFYESNMGLDHPFFHLREMGMHFLFLAVAISFYAFVFKQMERLKIKWLESKWIFPPLIQLILPLIIIFSLPFLAGLYDWRNCGMSLPLLSICSCVLLCWRCKKNPTESKIVFPLLWSVFGLVLLSKLGLFPRIWFYGFVLAMPPFVGAIYLLLWLLPKLLEGKFSVPPRFFRATICLALLAGFASLFCQSHAMFAGKKLAIGNGGDEIITFGPGIDIGEETKTALAWIEKNCPRDTTLAVMPEGATLNYLARRINPTPCLFWDPNSLSVFGQSNMTAAFEKNPPDYVVLVERDASQFGTGYFGHDPRNGLEVMQWIQKNYETAILIGSEPLHNGNFGIKILRRNTTVPPQNTIEKIPPGN